MKNKNTVFNTTMNNNLITPPYIFDIAHNNIFVKT